MELLKALCQVQAPSGNELPLKKFILNYVNENQSNWVSQPEIIHGEEFQDCLILTFGAAQNSGLCTHGFHRVYSEV